MQNSAQENVITRKHDEETTSLKSNIIGWLRFGILMVVIFLIFHYVIGISVINGNSMNPTLGNKNIILNNSYFNKYERGDIIIAKDSNGFDIIKRIVALPGETVEIKEGVVLINDNPLKEEYTVGESFDIPVSKIPEGHYFIIGDNRTPGESLDSRNAGPISKEQIKGEAVLSIFPFKGL